MRHAFTYTEAARILGVSPRHVRALVKAGALEVRHFGRAARIPKAALEALLGHPLDLEALERLEKAPARAGAGER